MGWVDAGQGNMIYVPDHSGPSFGPGPTQPSSPPPGAPTDTPPTSSQSTMTANVNPAVAAAASQEDRGVVAGAQTATLLQLSALSTRMDRLEAIIAKLIT